MDVTKIMMADESAEVFPDDHWSARFGVKARRKACIQRFRQAQHESRDWISFSDIAVWCASVNDDIKPDEGRRSLAYNRLQKSLQAGEFEVNGRSRVLFLSPETAMAKMTRAGLDLIVRQYDQTTIQNQYLASCWVPTDLARQWFTSQRLSVPPWLARPVRPTSSTAHDQTIVTEPARKLPVSMNSLVDWYKHRVEAWLVDKRPPNADQDLKAARGAFPDNQVSRDDIRQIRSKHGRGWTSGGRPSKTRKEF